MASPTLELFCDDQGEIWRVTYAGMTREHRQYWQAYVYWAWANALYGAAQAVEKR
jgi:hypothetical protein